MFRGLHRSATDHGPSVHVLVCDPVIERTAHVFFSNRLVVADAGRIKGYPESTVD
jgi:hypothetical protein